jgi:uncharacterized membrane protein
MTLPTLVAKAHAISAHFPIALLLLASVAGLWLLLSDPQGRTRPGWHALIWLSMLVGWLGSLAAVITGLLAQSMLPPQAPYGSVLNWHVSSGLAVAVVYAVLLYQRWLYGSARARQKRRKSRQLRNIDSTNLLDTDLLDTDLLDDPKWQRGCILLLIVGVTLIIVSGWQGGQLVFTWGVGMGK